MLPSWRGPSQSRRSAQLSQLQARRHHRVAGRHRRQRRDRDRLHNRGCVTGFVGQAIRRRVAVCGILQAMAWIGIGLNLILAVFNLLPIPPLDGSHVMKYLLPPALAQRYQQIGFAGIVIVLVLFCYTPVLSYWLFPAYVSASLAAELAVREPGLARRRRTVLSDGTIPDGSHLDRRARRDPTDDAATRGRSDRGQTTRRRRRSSWSSRISAGHSICCSRCSARSRSTSTTSRSRGSPSSSCCASARCGSMKRPSISRWPRGCCASRRRCCCRGGTATKPGTIRGRSWSGACSSTSRCVRSSTSSKRRAEGRRNRFARTRAARARTAAVRRPAVAPRWPICWRPWTGSSGRHAGPTFTRSIPRALDVAGAIAAARALLARRARIRWRDLVRVNAEPWEVLSVLLAVLELARLGECVLRQPRAFGAVEIVGLRSGCRDTLAGDSGTVDVPRLLSSLDQPPAYDTAGAAA